MLCLACILMAVAAPLLMTGCMSLQARAGKQFDTGNLQSLQVGQSGREDLRSILGEPYGKGSSMLPFHDSPRETWYYYYEESTLDESRRKFLFIYLDDSLYDGYMWFSSLPDEPPVPASK